MEEGKSKDTGQQVEEKTSDILIDGKRDRWYRRKDLEQKRSRDEHQQRQKAK